MQLSHHFLLVTASFYLYNLGHVDNLHSPWLSYLENEHVLPLHWNELTAQWVSKLKPLEQYLDESRNLVCLSHSPVHFICIIIQSILTATLKSGNFLIFSFSSSFYTGYNWSPETYNYIVHIRQRCELREDSICSYVMTPCVLFCHLQGSRSVLCCHDCFY